MVRFGLRANTLLTYGRSRAAPRRRRRIVISGFGIRRPNRIGRANYGRPTRGGRYTMGPIIPAYRRTARRAANKMRRRSSAYYR